MEAGSGSRDRRASAGISFWYTFFYGLGDFITGQLRTFQQCPFPAHGGHRRELEDVHGATARELRTQTAVVPVKAGRWMSAFSLEKGGKRALERNQQEAAGPRPQPQSLLLPEGTMWRRWG